MKPEYVLVDAVKPEHRPVDHGTDDVRAAMMEVGARENKQRIAEDIGLHGARAVYEWDELADRVGPQAAATHAATLYRAQPKIDKPAEPVRGEDDHHSSARRAMQAVKDRERARSEMPMTMQYLDATERRHGHLGVIETRKRWNEQLASDPVEALPRVTSELANEHYYRTTMPQLEKLADDYLAINKVAEEQMPHMLNALGTGAISTGDKRRDLELAHRYARWVTASDVAEPFRRETEAAIRAGQGVQEFAKVVAAEQEVEAFRQRHPGIHKTTWDRMHGIVSNSKDPNMTLERAYKIVRGR